MDRTTRPSPHLSSPRPGVASLAVVGLLLLTAAVPSGGGTQDEKEKKAPKPAKGASMNLAEARFALGEFADADEIAARVLEATPDSFRGLLLRGRLALLENRIGEAETWLERALELSPTHRATQELLAEARYRQDRFPESAVLLAKLGQEAKAAKLASIGDRRPYRSEGDRAVLAFEQTDPLPVVLVSVNSSDPAAFLIDTGGAEIILDTEWAAELGIDDVGITKGTFGGDRQADVHHGVASTVGLGGMILHDVPVAMLDTSPFSRVAPGMEVRGILGTVLFYHFLTTLDYPAGELRLEPRRGGERPAASEPKGDGPIRVPFWLGGDHYILARGRANDSESMLFLVDTGLAGLAFTCPRSTVEEAGIELVEQAAGSGVGGGGKVSIVPFMLHRLSLGEASRESLPGVFGPFPESLEHQAGFRIGGLVSHAFLRPWRVTFDFDAMEIVLDGATAP
jgi:predicted aspartyl protease